MSLPLHSHSRQARAWSVALFFFTVSGGAGYAAQAVDVPVLAEPAKIQIAEDLINVSGPQGFHLIQVGKQIEKEAPFKVMPAISDPAGRPKTFPELISAYFEAARQDRSRDMAEYGAARKNLLHALTAGIAAAEQDAKAATQKKDEAAYQRAIKNLYGITVLIAEVADKEYDKSHEKLIPELPFKMTRALTEDLARLADVQHFQGDYPAVLKALRNNEPITDEMIPVIKANWGVRQSAMSALGKITPLPGAAVPVIMANIADQTIPQLKSKLLELASRESRPDVQGRLLATAEMDPRRVAAWALIDLAHYTRLLPIGERLQTIAKVSEAAALGLKVKDPDELINGYCLLAVTEVSNDLNGYISTFNNQREYEKRREIELNEDFLATIEKLQGVNQGVLAGVTDSRHYRVQYTALEALESLLIARASLVRYFQEIPGQKNLESGKLLAKFVKIDPLQQIIADRGRTVTAMLDQTRDTKLRRKGMAILEWMISDLRLFEPSSDPVLQSIAKAIRNNREDPFVRWSAVNAIEKMIYKPKHFLPATTEEMPEKLKAQAQEDAKANRQNAASLVTTLLNHQLDVALIDLLTRVDPNLSSGSIHQKGSAYPDPDLCLNTVTVLHEIGEMANIVASDSEKKTLGARFAFLFNHMYLLNGPGSQYDPGVRYDVDMRLAAMKALVTIDGESMAGALDTMIEAIEKDPDVRIRMAASEAIVRFGALAEKAIPALTRVLARDDEDPEVRINASASLATITSARKKL